MSDIKLTLVGSAEFANGEKFTIEEKLNGRFVITDGKNSVRVADSPSIEQAWASIRYMAGISPKTERTRSVLTAEDKL